MNENEINEIKMRLERLEARLDFLYRRLGVGDAEVPNWTASPQVIALLKSGKKLDAIKAFMNETGASLKDAKEYVESLRV
jgi:hypothetical protein